MASPNPFGREDISSEYFIHRDLQERAATIVEEVRGEWRRAQHVEPCVIAWPEDGVRGDDGSVIDRAVLCRLPQLTAMQRYDILQGMVKRTKAYGLLLVLPGLDDIRVLFETRHGARAWVMRLERHGDVTVCCEPAVQDNAECVGLLWKPARN